MDEHLETCARNLASLEVPPPPPPVQSFDGTGPRLIITEIVNENFKSYYGRHRLGPLHKNFTSIVGPNGSGKSNVIDSLLFVFGYRAQRIRSKNMSVLIHKSELHPNVNYCTVEVHFIKIIDKDQNNFDVVPGTCLVIKRTAFRNNQSDYYINNKKCQFKDVAHLLRQHGIDIDHNRFLILQGEVEQISLMKPKAQAEGEEGMLEYLEDIVGSSRLKPVLDSLQKTVDELNETRNSDAQRAKVVEDEKAELEGPKNEAVAFLELENKITRKKNILYQRYVMETTESCSTVEREREAVKTNFEAKQTEMREVKADIKGKNSTHEKMKKRHDEMQKEVDKQTAHFKQLEREDTKLREDLKHCRGKTTTLEATKAAENKKLNEFRSQPEKCERQLQELQSKIQELEQKQKDADARFNDGLSRLKDETKACQIEKQGFEEQLLARQQDLAAAREKMTLAKTELELCLSAQTKEQTKLDDMKKNLDRVSKALEECQKNVADAEKSIPDMEKELNKLERRAREVTMEEEELTKQIRAKTTRVGEANAHLQTTGNRSRVLEALFNQQRKGTLQGICGRLGDLGAIDAKYDVAISTACGPLDHIVVESIDNAQKCVDFLKKSAVGMATFIGLDKIKHFEQIMNKPYPTPENVPRLFDLIKVEDRRFLPAFYFGIRDTLVAENLEQATRVAYQGGKAKHRVVTLAGELIDISGTMTGGGTRQSRGRMGRSVAQTPNADDLTPEQLKRMEAELAEQRPKLQELFALKVQLNTDRDNLRGELQKKKSDFKNWQKDIEAFTDQKSSLEQQVSKQEKVLASTVPDAAEKKRLETDVKRFEKAFEKLNEGYVAIQDQVKKVDDAIREITERVVGCVGKEKDALRREKEDTEKMITKTKVAAKTAERNIRNSEEKVAALEQDIEANKAKIEDVTKKLKELEEEATETVLKRDSAEKEAKAFEKEVVESKKDVGELEEREQELANALIDCKGRMEHVEATLKTFVQKKTYWEKELKKLQLHNIREMCGLPPLSEVVPDPPAQPTAPQPIDDTVFNSVEGDDEEEEEEDEEEENEDQANGQKEAEEKMDTTEVEQPQQPVVNENPKPVEEEDNLELKVYSVEYLQTEVDAARLAVKLTAMEDNLKNQKPNLDVLDEYRKKAEKLRKIMRQLNDVTKMRDQYRDRYDEIRKQRLNEFLDGFGIISSKLKEMYQMITLGGDADLEMVDTMDPFTEGIAFSVRPPKKSWKAIANLSGGEKTLSSLSLVFALHHYKPTPLYVMDEIDAALDFKNVSIVAHYIKERTKNAQFVIISLRNNMFELADRLVGIYKTFHCTKTVVIDPAKICVQVCKKEKDKDNKETTAMATVCSPTKLFGDRILRDRSADNLPNGHTNDEELEKAIMKLKLSPDENVEH